MKTALCIHGNLRSFLMPLRNDPSSRVCDRIVRNIAEPNDTDIFAVADTSDFFYDGSQYFPESRRIEIVNCDTFRICDSVKFQNHETSKEIINFKLKLLFGNKLKGSIVEPPADLSGEPKLALLNQYKKDGGSAPTMMVGQFRKIKMCHDLMEAQEKETGSYDKVIRCRFDLYCDSPMKVSSYDFGSADVYTPGIKGPLVHDWYAIGQRWAVGRLMCLYDNLGFTMKDGPMLVCECSRCGRIIKDGHAESLEAFRAANQGMRCPHCGNTDKFWFGDITLAAEHHTFRTMSDAGIRFKDARWSGYPYRYKDSSSGNQADVETVIKNLRLGPVTVVNYTTSSEFSVRMLG